LFRREWNLAFALVAAAAALLFAAGHSVAGAIAIALGAAAFVARWSAMRKQDRGFYGQDKRPR
jgi:membrane protease YdiL (CAAX protease family)